MEGPAPRRSTAKKLVASAALLAGVGAFVSTGVFSAWTDSASNSSSLKSATISLANPVDNAVLGLLNLVPGDVLVRCVRIVNDGNAPVTLGVTPTKTDTEGLGAALTVKIEEGAASSAVTNGSSCAGFVAPSAPVLPFGAASTLASMSTTKVDYTGFAANAGKDFRITVTMASDALSTLQAKSASLGLSFDATTVGSNR